MNSPENHTILRSALRLLKWFCPDHLYEEIEGDLIQKFHRDVKEFDEARALRRLVWNVIRFFRPGILFRNQFSPNLLSINIIPHYLNFTYRILGRHKLFTSINLSGLAVGMALCLLMINYVIYEKSYDHFNDRMQDIVRVSYSRYIDGEIQFTKAQVFPGVGEALREELPEIENFVRMFPLTMFVEAIFSPETKGTPQSFIEPSAYAVDSSFLKIFSLHLLYGDSLTALQGEKKIILSAAAARKYFGEENPLNKIIHWDGMGDWTVTGVFKDLPQNSHMRFDCLISWMKVYGPRSAWNWDGFYTYLLLQPGTNVAELELKIQRVLNEKMQSTGQAKRVEAKFYLQSLEDIHLTSQLSGEMQVNGNSRVVEALSIVAVFILILAFINYINLSLARSVRRTKEVGVRKVIGSTHQQLMSLFFTEAFALNILAFVMAVVLFFLASPVFDSLIGKSVEPLIWQAPGRVIMIAIVVLLIFSLLASLYPSRIMATINPGHTMKGTVGSWRRPLFERVLLVLQFLVTIVLVASTLIVSEQVSYMQHQDLGFALDQNIVIKILGPSGSEMDTTFLHKLELFKNRVINEATVKSASVTSNIPGRENEWMGRLQGPENEKELISALRTRVDRDFIKTYGLTLINGVNFSDENSSQVILNESAVKMLGYKNSGEAIGSKIMRDRIIIGVVKDFHERSLKEPVFPALYTVGEGYMKFITVNMNSQDSGKTVEVLQQAWTRIFPDMPFEYFFLDDFFNQQYHREEQLEKVIGTFSVLGIFIACLGLFGFTYFMIHQRVREIGIRKVLGASGASLLRLFSSEFLLLFLLAGILSSPLGYWLAEKWLTAYPYRIDLQFMHFVLPIVGVSCVAFSSVVLLLIKAINTNPTEAIKHE